MSKMSYLTLIWSAGITDAHVYYKFVIKEKHYSVQCSVHMMMSMRMNTCMETIHGTSVDRLW